MAQHLFKMELYLLSHPISVDDSEDKLPSINRNNKETYNEYDFLL